jgi:Ca2+-binding RTX toxin-like protein
MTLNAHEQYILELINRGRLDPLAEAARFGIDLNEGLNPGQIGGHTQQVVAPNSQLEAAATAHSIWMMATNTFSHTGSGGSNVFARITGAGYEFTGPYQTYGENLAYGGNTASIDLLVQAEIRYNDLFLSASHRKNTLNETFREVGIGHEQGMYNQYHASMLTENFGTSGTEHFITGVAYNDNNNNDFYNIGEGRGDITILADGGQVTTAGAGGYGLGVDPDSSTDVTIRQGGTTLAILILDTEDQNAKLDVIRAGGQWELALSASADLETGIGRARLLGKDDLDLTGHGGANHLTGNAGDNEINGMGDNDQLFGGNGWDVLIDGGGTDTLTGGGGRDRFVLEGDGLADTITDWGRGDDTLDIRGWSGVSGLGDLTLTATGAGLTITSETETLYLRQAGGGTIAANTLSAGDFMFGNLPSQSEAPEPLATPEVPELAADPMSGTTVIAGSNADSVMAGTGGSDYIMGYGGRDILGGSGGSDTLYGGTGNDRYILNSAGDAIGGEVAYSQGGGIDTVEAWVDYVLPKNLEILRLQGTADLDGAGGYAPEVLVGNVGDNMLDGGGGNDRIVAKAGDDVLVGRTGADTLVGDEGADTFILTSSYDSRAGAANRDFIHGFQHGADQIDLTRVDASTVHGGHQSFDFIGNVAFSGTGAASAGELRYFTFGGGNYNIVEADLNGDGVADMQMFVNLTNYMTGTDFIL